MTERTTAEHRAEVEAWRATAPADDTEILEPMVDKPNWVQSWPSIGAPMG
jgi:hypothetical protein